MDIRLDIDMDIRLDIDMDIRIAMYVDVTQDMDVAMRLHIDKLSFHGAKHGNHQETGWQLSSDVCTDWATSCTARPHIAV